jgi:hypothetical protein
MQIRAQLQACDSVHGGFGASAGLTPPVYLVVVNLELVQLGQARQAVYALDEVEGQVERAQVGAQLKRLHLHAVQGGAGVAAGVCFTGCSI